MRMPRTKKYFLEQNIGQIESFNFDKTYLEWFK